MGRQPDYIISVGGTFKMKDKIEAVNIVGKIKKVMINIELSWITPPKKRLLTIIGEDLSLEIDCISQNIISIKGQNTTPVKNIPNNTLQQELKYFLDNVKTLNKRNIAAGEIGIDNLKLLNAAKKSITDKKIIYINK